MPDDRPSNSWRYVRLGDVCLVNPDKRDAAWPHEEIEYIDISSVGTGVINTPPARIRVSDAPSRAQRLVRRGDTIIATVRPNLRSFAYLSETKPNTVVSTGFAVLRATDNLDQRFIYYVISDQSFTDYLAARAHGSAYPAVSVAVIQDAELLLPPLDVQRSIGEVLGALDDKIEQNRRTARSLERIARAIFRAWFVDFEPVKAKATGATFFPSMPQSIFDALPTCLVSSESGPVPKGWEVKPLSKAVHLTMGQSPKSEFYNQAGDGLPFHQGVTDYGFRFPTHRVYCTAEGRLAEPRDVLLSVRAPVGRINVADRRLVLGRGLAGLRHRNDRQSFLLHQLCYVFAEEDAIGDGTIYKAVTKQFLAQMPLLAPAEDAQQAFDEMTRPLDDLVAASEAESRKLAELRDLLLPRLLSGQARVEVADG